MAAVVEKQRGSRPPHKPLYRPINLATLRIDTVTGFDLYIKTRGVDDPVLYRQHDLPFTPETRQRLREHEVQQLLISSSQEGQYQRYVEAHLPILLEDDTLNLEEKSTILYDCAQHVVHDILDNPGAGEVLPRSRELVGNVADFMFRTDSSFTYFLKTCSFDYQVYTHSVNVFVYCISLAKQMGLDDISFLHEFGTGALLHDIGKSRVGPQILHCRGALNAEQWRIMKQHPGWGYEILREQGVTSEIILNVTKYHHEKLSGGGYPEGLSGDQIPGYVRIATVCDIFDALTTERVYKGAINSFPALRLMQRDMMGELDSEVFNHFVELMSGPDKA